MRYSKGFKTDRLILGLLAKEGEAAQYDMPTLLGISYRTVLRHLKLLETRELVEVLRTERSKKKGKDRKIYGITFYGLMAIVNLLDNEKIDEIAQKHREKWLIFAEWSFLLKKYPLGKSAFYELVRMVSRRHNFLESEPLKPFPEIVVRQMGFPVEEWRQEEAYIQSEVLKKIRQDYTNLVLNLRYFTDNTDLKFGLKGMEKEELTMKKATLALYAENSRIKEYIDKQFEQEKTAHDFVNSLRTHWEKLTTKR